MVTDERRTSTAEIPTPPGRIAKIVFALTPRDIALFKAIVESYDNLVTLRTEGPRRHYLCLYFSAEMESEVRAILDSLRERFSISEIDSSGCVAGNSMRNAVS
jgi:hypothetical protein